MKIKTNYQMDLKFPVFRKLNIENRNTPLSQRGVSYPGVTKGFFIFSKKNSN